MASTYKSALLFKGDLLVGKSNYIEWLNNATLYLELNGFMPYIKGTKLAPDINLYYKDSNSPYSPELAIRYIDRKTEFEDNSLRALGAVKSIISLDNIKRFSDKKDAKELWDAITSTYGETSLEEVNRYLNKIIDSSPSSFTTIDEYTNTIQASALYLKDLGFELPKPIIACLLFKNLGSAYDSFTSRKYEELSSNIKDIKIETLISSIIAEEARMDSNVESKAFKAVKNSQKKCSYCKKQGHLKEECFSLHPELLEQYKAKSNTGPVQRQSSKAIMTSISSDVDDEVEVLM
jgi:hypothetical protein